MGESNFIFLSFLGVLSSVSGSDIFLHTTVRSCNPPFSDRPASQHGNPGEREARSEKRDMEFKKTIVNRISITDRNRPLST